MRKYGKNRRTPRVLRRGVALFLAALMLCGNSGAAVLAESLQEAAVKEAQMDGGSENDQETTEPVQKDTQAQNTEPAPKETEASGESTEPVQKDTQVQTTESAEPVQTETQVQTTESAKPVQTETQTTESTESVQKDTQAPGTEPATEPVQKETQAPTEGTEPVTEPVPKETEITEKTTEAVEEIIFTADLDALAASSESAAEADGVFRRAAKEQSGYVDDVLWKYMTEHYLEVDGHKLVDGDTIQPTEGFRLSVRFELKMADLLEHGLKYTYQLPEHITIGDIASENAQESLFDSDGNEIATYFVKNDKIYLTFPGYYSSTFVTFHESASWDVQATDTEVAVDWRVEMPKYKIDNSELVVNKTSTGFRSEDDGTLVDVFQIKVQPSKEDGSISGVTFTDTLSSEKMKLYKDYYGEGKDIRVTSYTVDGRKLDTVYYAGAQEKGEILRLENLNLVNGGYYVVEYAVKAEASDRIAIDAAGRGSIGYTNKATAAYETVNPATGGKMPVSKESEISKNYTADTEWVLKKMGEPDVETLAGEGKYIVPYTVEINKHRNYSVGGAAVHDILKAETGEKGGKMTYYTEAPAPKPTVTATNRNGTTTTNMKWVVLEDELYTRLSALLAKNPSTVLERLQSTEMALASALLTASECNTLEEAVKTCIFANNALQDFIWILPKDTVPTTYKLDYQTVAPADVKDFSNGADFWYAAVQKPTVWGVGYVDAEVALNNKLLHGVKSNDGVYQGADGNYYVDWHIALTVGAGSTGFKDIYLDDTAHGKSIENHEMLDWRVGLSEANARSVHAFSNTIKISSSSERKDVQEVVAHAFSAPLTWYSYNNKGLWAAKFSNVRSWYEDAGRDVFEVKGTEGGWVGYLDGYQAAGQFDLDATGEETYNYKRTEIFLGDLPPTLNQDGYTIDIRYTTQVNPYLVEWLRENKEASDYNNHCEVKTSYVNPNQQNAITIRPTTGDGKIGEMNSHYRISANDIQPCVDKAVTHDIDTSALHYTIKINKDRNVTAFQQTYKITDVLNMGGLKYKAGTFKLVNADTGEIIYTDILGQTAVSQYKDKCTFTVTNSESTVNRFTLTLDNSGDAFAVDGDGGKKLIPMLLTYDVDTSQNCPTDITIENTAQLGYTETLPNNGGTMEHIIGEATCDVHIDKALDKQLLVRPDANNGYQAEFSIVVDPSSENAKELGEIRAGDSFTVRDRLSENLLLLRNTVVVEEYTDTTEPEKITGRCKVAYHMDEDYFDVEITGASPDKKYRITYKAEVTGVENTYVTYTNEAEVFGTSVRKEQVEKKVLIAAYGGESAAREINIQLSKFDRYDAAVGLQATFRLYRYSKHVGQWDAVTGDGGGLHVEDIQTDAKGVATIAQSAVTTDGLTISLLSQGKWYKLEEVEWPDGYIHSAEPIYFYVQNNTTGHTVDKPNPNEFPPEITAGAEYTLVRPRHPGQLNYINASNEKFGFDIEKKDASTKEALAGAGFTLYRDEACTDAVATARDTDGDGRISFENLSNCGLTDMSGTLYLKETTVPHGYVDSGKCLP